MNCNTDKIQLALTEEEAEIVRHALSEFDGIFANSQHELNSADKERHEKSKEKAYEMAIDLADHLRLLSCKRHEFRLEIENNINGNPYSFNPHNTE